MEYYRSAETVLPTSKRLTIHVRLLGEGTEVARPVEAVKVGDGLYEILPTPNYDPNIETWEFPPGSIVRLSKDKRQDGEILLAVKDSPLRDQH